MKSTGIVAAGFVIILIISLVWCQISYASTTCVDNGDGYTSCTNIDQSNNTQTANCITTSGVTTCINNQ